MLAEQIRTIHERSRFTYGAPRVHAELHASQQRISRKRVARLMRQVGLAGRPPRRFRRTTWQAQCQWPGPRDDWHRYRWSDAKMHKRYVGKNLAHSVLLASG